MTAGEGADNAAGGRRLFYPRHRWCPGRWLYGGILLLFLLPGSLRFWQAVFPLSQPAPGVLCDRQAQRCAGKTGLSVADTAAAFGASAAGALQTWLSRGGDGRVWTFSNGLTCDAGRQRCWRSPGRDDERPRVAGYLFSSGQYARLYQSNGEQE